MSTRQVILNSRKHHFVYTSFIIFLKQPDNIEKLISKNYLAACISYLKLAKMQLKTDSGDFVHMTTCKHYINIIICCPVRPGST